MQWLTFTSLCFLQRNLAGRCLHRHRITPSYIYWFNNVCILWRLWSPRKWAGGSWRSGKCFSLCDQNLSERVVNLEVLGKWFTSAQAFLQKTILAGSGKARSLLGQLCCYFHGAFWKCVPKMSGTLFWVGETLWEILDLPWHHWC